MFQMIISILIIMSSMIFMQMNHPLAMGLMLLIQTLFICLLTGLMSKSFWFSYILFLVFLGGMLVLFIYVTSLASNEMFSMSMKTFMLSLMFILTSMFMIMFMDLNLLISNIENNEMSEMYNMNSFLQENSLTLNKIYNYPTNLVTIILINYLLITLIAIVKITNIFYGPLRQMN
uniref:NADH-ubiquinone oxidoreductase chain 6 n=1 Tax=Xanthochlorus tibetensis TaxID=2779315 RepID=A0A7U3N916_9MUSC|nr:NADH dehydrogenase subunit 6 [Xanthochlorus tibetensis]QOL12460.1 NADH dehydrogenase subunit 6 [Xanthochlorus tibetensis]